MENIDNKKEELAEVIAPIVKKTRAKRKPKPKVVEADLITGLNKKKPIYSDYDREMVTGYFTNIESRGATLKFPFSGEGEVAKIYELHHGRNATVPRYVANHINACVNTVSEYRVDDKGNQLGEEQVEKRRFSFENISF